MEKKEIKQLNTKRKDKKRLIIITVCLVGALVLCAVLIAILESVGEGNFEYETYPPLPDNKLYETYPEDFDIMEYEEYLSFDRNIYHNDTNTGVTVSVDRDQAAKYGKAFLLLYDVIIAINEGDSDSYNSYMGNARLEMGEFTQQQIYDISITPYLSSEDNGYEEITYKVTYRIHENNGTYRNNIESDKSRPQYFVINDSTGEFKVADILEQGYKVD